MRTLGITIAVILVGSSVAGAARADVPLSSEARTRLDATIQSAHTRDAATFDAVRGVVAQADALDHHKGGRFYPMTSLLRGVMRGHPEWRWRSSSRSSRRSASRCTSETARIALRAGLLEAAGNLKNPAAAPVYRAIIASETEFYAVRAAVEALGKLGNDPDVAMLATLAQTRGPKQDAVVAGMGACRRVAAAKALEGVVPESDGHVREAPRARALVDGLRVGARDAERGSRAGGPRDSRHHRARRARDVRVERGSTAGRVERARRHRRAGRAEMDRRRETHRFSRARDRARRARHSPRAQPDHGREPDHEEAPPRRRPISLAFFGPACSSTPPAPTALIIADTNRNGTLD